MPLGFVSNRWKAKRLTTALLLVALAFWGAACGRSGQDDVGVVAKVNGRPITLSMLEFQYDILHFDAYAGTLPTVGSLREAYGHILGGLIAQELVSQELEHRGQQVTDEELREAEAKIRADYPDDAFDQMLAEEFIDLDMWRKHLRYVCAVEKFQRLVLRPQVHIDYREAEAYYRAHIEDFKQPERLRLVVVRAPSRELVEKAVAQYRAQNGPAGIEAALPEVQVREVTVRKDLLPTVWADTLHGTNVGGASAAMTDKYGPGGAPPAGRVPGLAGQGGGCLGDFGERPPAAQAGRRGFAARGEPWRGGECHHCQRQRDRVRSFANVGLRLVE